MDTTNSHEDDLFRALADNTRREIVAALIGKPMPVTDLTQRFRISRPAVSRHLRLLKEAGIVEPRAQGRRNVYFVRTQALREMDRWLDTLWESRMSRFRTLAGPVA